MMLNKIRLLLKKKRELILYLFFGGLTTVVSFGSYFISTELLNIYYIAAQAISWVTAVAFAFVVNKLFVFEDKTGSIKYVFIQIWKFVSVRIASGVLETLLLSAMVELLLVEDGISKVIVSVITVILNYVASKLIIFKKKAS